MNFEHFFLVIRCYFWQTLQVSKSFFNCTIIQLICIYCYVDNFKVHFCRNRLVGLPTYDSTFINNHTLCNSYKLKVCSFQERRGLPFLKKVHETFWEFLNTVSTVAGSFKVWICLFWKAYIPSKLSPNMHIFCVIRLVMRGLVPDLLTCVCPYFGSWKNSTVACPGQAIFNEPYPNSN